jgi:hypothetical protein
MNKLRRFLTLPPRRRDLLIKSLLLLPIIDLSLRLVGYKKTCLILDRAFLNYRTDSRAPRAEILHEVAWATITASRRIPYAASCLRRSILIAHFLRLHGIIANIQFAVRRSQGSVEAHAWVESDGEVVGDSPATVSVFIRLHGNAASRTRAADSM